MRNEESWNRFERTGAIKEYLNYTACTNEKPFERKKENNDYDPDSYSNRDSASNNANR